MYIIRYMTVTVLRLALTNLLFATHTHKTRQISQLILGIRMRGQQECFFFISYTTHVPTAMLTTVPLLIM